MADNWYLDKEWGDRFVPQICSFLGSVVMKEAPIEEDRQHNTDLIVLNASGLRIGCRVRRYVSDAEKRATWFKQFTIRSERPNGTQTELDKILSGWGDLFFYGFANEQETHIAKCFVGRLDVFRLVVQHYRGVHDGKLPGYPMSNMDGSSKFRVFWKRDFPNFVLKSRDW